MIWIGAARGFALDADDGAASRKPTVSGLAKYLTTLKHVDAPRVPWPSLALYAPEETVRARGHIDGLKSRPAKDYTDMSCCKVSAIPSPWSQKRAAEAARQIASQGCGQRTRQGARRTRPAAPPAKKTIEGKASLVHVRELVRVNHHRNCVLCHAPAARDDAVFSAPVALPDRELPAPSEGYGGRQSSPDLFVRIDMTYLRQDFSLDDEGRAGREEGTVAGDAAFRFLRAHPYRDGSGSR